MVRPSAAGPVGRQPSRRASSARLLSRSGNGSFRTFDRSEQRRWFRILTHLDPLPTVSCEPVRKKLRDAVKAETLPRASELEILDEAVTKNVIGAAERVQLLDAARARDEAIQVDEFSKEEFATLRG